MGEERLRFAIVPSVLDEPVREAHRELCELLSADSGYEVEPVCLDSLEALAKLLGAGGAELGWVSPTQLMMVPELSPMVPLLSSVRQGHAFFHAILFTAAEGPVRSVEDLPGTRAAWVAPTSAAGYLVPRLSLARRGIALDDLFAAERFMGGHGAVAVAVFGGIADVGATYAHFDGGSPDGGLMHAGYMESMPDAQGRVLDVAGPIPADMIVAHPSVSMQARTAVAAALCRLPADAVGKDDLARVIGADDFRPVSVNALKQLWELLAACKELRRQS